MSLADELRAAGLTVKEYSGWSTRGGSWAQGGAPVGLMEHHTANPVPYPVDQLAGSDQGRIKCNINTKPDGTIWLIAYEACNYSSGSGVGKVLSEVKAGTPPSENAVDRGWDSGDDDTNGNPYFFNFENDHAGDGGPMPDVQFQAIIVASQVVAKHFGLSEKNTISHAEWTARKTDPYFNGSRRVIEDIRSGMAGEPIPEPEPEPEPEPTPPPSGDIVLQVTRKQIKKGAKDSSFGGNVYKAQGLLAAHGYDLGTSGGRGNGIDGAFGNTTDQATRSFQKKKGLSVDGIIGEKTWAALEK